MPVVAQGGKQLWRRRARGKQLAIWAGWFVTTLIFVLCWQLISEKTVWLFVTDAHIQAADLGRRMVPPKLSYMQKLWWPLWDTVNIATLGTMIALILAVPIAFCAARNTTPSRLIVRPLALFIIVSSRSINSLIWALLLVSTKLLYEAIEEIDERQVEAITATGASQAQILTFGIVPQVLPAFAGISVFRWDINIRESTVLGLVGAGGIGLQLNASILTLAWTEVSMILLVIIATVVVSEWVSAKVRHAII
jgi:phosphonate transport system permease protein